MSAAGSEKCPVPFSTDNFVSVPRGDHVLSLDENYLASKNLDTGIFATLYIPKQHEPKISKWIIP